MLQKRLKQFIKTNKVLWLYVEICQKQTFSGFQPSRHGVYFLSECDFSKQGFILGLSTL